MGDGGPGAGTSGLCFVVYSQTSNTSPHRPTHSIVSHHVAKCLNYACAILIPCAGRTENDVADFTGMTQLHTITIRMVKLSLRHLSDVTQGLERFSATRSVLYHVHLDFLGTENISRATVLQDIAFLLQQLECVLVDLRLQRVSYALVNCPPLMDSFDSRYGSRSRGDLFPGLRESGVVVTRQLDVSFVM